MDLPFFDAFADFVLGSYGLIWVNLFAPAVVVIVVSHLRTPVAWPQLAGAPRVLMPKVGPSTRGESHGRSSTPRQLEISTKLLLMKLGFFMCNIYWSRTDQPSVLYTETNIPRFS